MELVARFDFQTYLSVDAQDCSKGDVSLQVPSENKLEHI